MQFRKKSDIIEAITFDELVKYGVDSGASAINGMPRSFKYNGVEITYENDNCYLFSTCVGYARMTPEDILITEDDGAMRLLKKDIFDKKYEPAQNE